MRTEPVRDDGRGRGVAAAVVMAGLMCAAALGSGCAPVIQHFMVDAPNAMSFSRGDDPPEWVCDFQGVDEQFRVEVGPPAASLLVWVLEPDEEAEPAEREQSEESPAEIARCKGTVLMLHGYRAEMSWMLAEARDLNRAGYRAVLVDLRGHGCSTGDHLTYGVQEARDLSQVIDALVARGLVDGELGVWGISYGASTAIMLSAEDPRIDAVVAVSPFSSMREIVPHFVRIFLPWVGWHMSDAEITRIVDAGGAEAGFDPDEADIAAAAAAGGAEGAPLLLLHGSWDWLVPPSHSERILASAEAAGREVKREKIGGRWWGAGHLSIWFDPGGHVEAEGVAWLDRWLAAE